jgi:1-deoxy-D-xylulose 5-phosphate reductoisomerase
MSIFDDIPEVKAILCRACGKPIGEHSAEELGKCTEKAFPAHPEWSKEELVGNGDNES